MFASQQLTMRDCNSFSVCSAALSSCFFFAVRDIHEITCPQVPIDLVFIGFLNLMFMFVYETIS